MSRKKTGRKAGSASAKTAGKRRTIVTTATGTVKVTIGQPKPLPCASPPPCASPEGGAGGFPEAEASRAVAEAFIEAGGKERERLVRIMNFLPCYVALVSADHKIIYHNKAFNQYFGEPEGRSCFQAMRKQEKPCRFCQVAEATAGHTSSSVMEWVHPETRHAFRVYSYPFEDVDGSRCLLETGFNITSVLRVQQALDLSEQSYRAITDNLSIGIALVDPSLHIKTGNTRMGMWFSGGFKPNSCVCELLHCGEQWERALAEADFFCPDCPFRASLADGAGHEKELFVAFSDGREHAVRLVTCPVIPTRGKLSSVRAIILMLEDITKRIQVNRQLQRARKMEALNTLAGGIAHEINQPLSALHLYTGGLQMLLEKSGSLPQETTLERLGLIMKEADKIRGIITHMRALVMKEGSVSLAPVMLKDSVTSVHDLMRARFEEMDIRFTVDIPDSIPPVQANDPQMEQVLVNLLSNAMHALGKEGSQDRHILVSARPSPDLKRVSLCVADNGQGLGDGGEHVFDPFYTTKEKHEGIGLGLSIVHGFVSLWGGSISARAKGEPLGGASFTLELRVAQNAPAGAVADRPNAPLLPDGQKAGSAFRAEAGHDAEQKDKA
ncbi:histidine kinase [Desulfovibrio sp. OttesenSCG-928-G15]|nr:histidine kinase [Desulfovibrio sp. OttesenSCG-928-G15]